MSELGRFAGRGNLALDVIRNPDAAGYAVRMWVPDGLTPVMTPDEADQLAAMLAEAAELARREAGNPGVPS
jgi:hypothetical protein